ncbi:serine/threonine protein kinase [Pleurocapsa sp. PCC 7327]|uniref:protein kinase domain-containing protein n=1 Tax=Pleurocapsa sp. PCC 7327 TaxID=118163 RepID=UPI00029FB374|nr:pentapeptide repeat-containing protein [Pleurocapsa sp. PCC 7327]AFY77982.1 serine/threonine protein kinase [Pleurocapsa sp. PCC 7327]
MSYCVNPSCSQPKNPKNAEVCQACGSSLILRGRYRVLGILGKGGFGATFVAVDLSLPGKPWCVVKQLRPSTDDPALFKMAKELFEREAETLGRIGNHPQVPRLLDYFEDRQQFYLVQEYVKGHNLHQEVKKNGPFSEAGVRQFLSEVLPILQYIHTQRVIHRDIKPANIIRREEDRQLVLIDFGAVTNQVNSVANSASTQTAFTAFAVGTAGFAPPEQMAMRPVFASDIYAVGVTCLYLLIGKSPKDLGTDPTTGEITWERWITVSESFAKVLKTMLEVSVRHRYKTANEVLQALELVPYSESLAQSMINAPNLEKGTGNSAILATTPISKIGMGDRTRIDRATRTSANPPTPNLPSKAAAGSNFSAALNYQMSSNYAIDKNRLASPSKSPASKKPVPKLDANSIVEGYKNGRRDFAQQELNNLNLSRASLPGAIFHQSQLNQANFQRANLANADFGHANLTHADLRNANLSRAYLSYADLKGADLRGADLSFAHLTYANLKGANLCGANLTNAKVTEEQLVYAKTNRSTIMPTGRKGFW